MTLLEEYKNQSNWREWERYLNKLPLNENQTVNKDICKCDYL